MSDFTAVADFDDDNDLDWKPEFSVHTPSDLDEPDRVTVKVMDMVVDIIANQDESIYIEMYPYARDKQVVVTSAFIDRYENISPNLRIRLADKPSA